MSVLQFIAALTSSLAWPVVLLAVTLIFRRGINNRIVDIRRVAWGDKSVDFGEKLDRIETEAAVLLPANEEPKALAPPDDPVGTAAEEREVARFEDVVEAEPRLGVIGAWASIEREMKRVAVERGYGPKSKSATFLLHRLSADGVLDREIVAILDSLRQLRNEVVHGAQRQISAEDARRYNELASIVISKLRATV